MLLPGADRFAIPAHQGHSYQVSKLTLSPPPRAALVPRSGPVLQGPSSAVLPAQPSHSGGVTATATRHDGPLLDPATLPELPPETRSAERRRSPPRRGVHVQRDRQPRGDWPGWAQRYAEPCGMDARDAGSPPARSRRMPLDTDHRHNPPGSEIPTRGLPGTPAASRAGTPDERPPHWPCCASRTPGP